MRKALFVIVGLVAAGIAVWWYYPGREGAGNGRIFVSGAIEATEVDLSFRISEKIQELKIEEGDRVKAGQVVAKLNTKTLTAQQKSARADLRAAQAVLDELETGSRQEDIEMARAELKAAESRMHNAQSEHDRHEPLFQQGAISASSMDSRSLALKVALADFNRAKKRLEELVTGPRPEQIRAASARVDTARWNVRRLQLDLDDSSLISPIDGVILVKAREEGEVVLPGATVATVARVDEVWLKGYVSEKDLGRLKLAQKVEVTTDTYPDKRYIGRVTFISSRAEFTPKNVQTKEERIKQVYRVKVTIPNPDYELKIGMPAEGWILTGEAANREKGPNAK